MVEMASVARASALADKINRIDMSLVEIATAGHGGYKLTTVTLHHPDHASVELAIDEVDDETLAGFATTLATVLVAKRAAYIDELTALP